MRISVQGTRYIILIWLVIIFSIGSVIYISYHRNNEDLRKLMLNEAEQYIYVISVGTEMSIHSLDVAEQLTMARLLDNAGLIEKNTHSHIPSSTELQQIADENNLQMISILDRNGKIISGTAKNPEIYDPKQNPEIYDVLSGKDKYKFIGFMGEDYHRSVNYGVVIGGENVGAVVVNTEPEAMLDLRKEIGIGNVFKKISIPQNVRYIVLQDTLGIIASSPGVTRMTNILEDSFLQKAAPGKFSSRFMPVEKDNILEIVQPLIVDDYNMGLLRIGLDSSVYWDITNRAKRNSLILFFIAVVTATLLSMYFILRQNYLLLSREHDRMLGEVKHMEENARRAEKLTSMGRLAAGVAHEIRNPLNSINMIVQLLDTEFESVSNKEQYSRFLSSIKKEITRISNIVENFLKFLRPPKLVLEKVQMKSIVDEVIAIIVEKAKTLKIDIKYDIDPGIICVCDINQMKQVILNLLLNSIDAVGSYGKININVESKTNEVILNISDSGTGISEDIIDNIFDPYFTTKSNGVGLGLSEVHRIISLHNGTISAKNTGKGAVFTISLPLTGQNV